MSTFLRWAVGLENASVTMPVPERMSRLEYALRVPVGGRCVGRGVVLLRAVVAGSPDEGELRKAVAVVEDCGYESFRPNWVSGPLGDPCVELAELFLGAA
jgi:hypothetical protein